MRASSKLNIDGKARGMAILLLLAPTPVCTRVRYGHGRGDHRNSIRRHRSLLYFQKSSRTQRGSQSLVQFSYYLSWLAVGVN